MGGVPNQKDAAHLISLRLTAVDTVVHPPDGIAQHATRGPGIEYRLEVLEGWLPQRQMISLGWANIGSEVARPLGNGKNASIPSAAKKKAC
jgi:hypothetical protein